MAKFLRCVGLDRTAYHINVEQIAWMFRPRGARHTVIRFAGSPDAISVLEAPDQITSHGHSGEHADHGSAPMARTRASTAQSGARVRALDNERTF